MLDRESLWKLRNQIVLNSMYTDDYENDMGITPFLCGEFFIGYVAYLSEIIEEMTEESKEFISDDEWYEKLLVLDTIDNLEAWYNCFDQDPFKPRYFL